MTVDLVRLFLAGQDDLLGVDDDDVIARIEKRRVTRVLFTHEDARDL